MNLVVDEHVTWAEIASGRADRRRAEPGRACRTSDTYRDAERLGAGKKSILLSIKLRDAAGTLAGEQADAMRDEIVARAAASWAHNCAIVAQFAC